MLDQITDLVVEVAREELLPRFDHSPFRLKADRSLVTEADLALQRRLGSLLKERWPEIALLGEEMPREEQEGRLRETGRLWCLDPLDGTTNFVAGVPFFSVSLALLEGGSPTLGLVYDPIRDERFVAVEGEGAFMNGHRLGIGRRATELARAVAVVDFKRLPAGLRHRLTDSPPYASQRSFGSSALEWAWVAAGRGDLYLHGGQRLWDYAAGSLILAEAGGLSSTLGGEAVASRSIAPRSVVAALDRDLFKEWSRWLKGGDP